MTRAEAKQRTREELLLAGLELFNEEGVDGPSLDAICERAGRTRGAFYVHFADRDAFELAVMERILADYVGIIVQTADPAGDLERSVRAFTAAMAAADSGGDVSPFLARATGHLHLLMQGVRRSPEIQERFVTLVTGAIERLGLVVGAGQGAESVRPDVDARETATLLVALVFGFLTLHQTGVPYDLDAIADMVLAALAPQNRDG